MSGRGYVATVAESNRTMGDTQRALAGEIATWLRAHLEDSGAERFVLGLSGGIDSATVCALCCLAVGPQRVTGAIMPAHSHPADAADAELVAAAFGVAVVRTDLSPVVEAFVAAVPTVAATGTGLAGDPRPENRERLALANVKPRLRMTTLYYLANLQNGLVVGTGNKSEALIGYFTKYGDGGVDLLPIADLYKHDVRAIARALNVPEPIVSKSPSAGLWQGQTDEGELGMSYDQLDQALHALERGETAGVDPAVLARVRGMGEASAHKRRPVPVFRR